MADSLPARGVKDARVRDLVYRSQQGCDLSREILIREFENLVQKIAFGFGSSKVDRADLVQCGRIKFNRAIDLFDVSRTDCAFVTFAYRAIWWAVASEAKQASKRREVFFSEAHLSDGDSEEAESIGGLVASQVIDESVPEFGAAIDHREIAAEIRSHIRRFPRRSQQVFRWRVHDRLSFVEIGRRIGRSHQRARKIYLDMVDNIKEQMDPVAV